METENTLSILRACQDVLGRPKGERRRPGTVAHYRKKYYAAHKDALFLKHALKK